MMRRIWPALLLAIVLPLRAEVREDHEDVVRPDPALDLKTLVDLTVENYPKTPLGQALRAEAEALGKVGDSLIAGPPQFFAIYTGDPGRDDSGFREIETGIDLPLWRPGQRGAQNRLAEAARRLPELTGAALRLEVAGLLRETLWEIALAENRLKLAQEQLQLAERFAATVQRRVELGDLPRADVLLAERDVVEKRTAVVEAQAALTDARVAYRNLTGLDRMPTRIQETRSRIADIRPEHPRLSEIEARVARLRAETEVTRRRSSGSPSVGIGTRIERGSGPADEFDSLQLKLTLPFGGARFNGPAVAQAERAVAEGTAERDLLLRRLKRGLHEARHTLEVDEKALKLARDRLLLASEHARMHRIAFDAGEIQLVEFLRLQGTANAARLEAEQRQLMLQRDIARYNQAAGTAP